MQAITAYSAVPLAPSGGQYACLVFFPFSVLLGWVPGSMQLVQFRVWDRTFVVALVQVWFVSPQAQAPLFLSGTALVSLANVQLSASEQQVFDRLRAAASRDAVLNEAWPQERPVAPAALT